MSNPEPTLADLFTPAAVLWSPADLAAMWQHQLASRLLTDAPLMASLPVPPDQATFGEILRHPAPKREALIAIKNYGKSVLADPNHAFPSEVATALYYLAIFVARKRGGGQISKLDDAALAHARAWLAAQAWLDCSDFNL